MLISLSVFPFLSRAKPEVVISDRRGNSDTSSPPPSPISRFLSRALIVARDRNACGNIAAPLSVESAEDTGEGREGGGREGDCCLPSRKPLLTLSPVLPSGLFLSLCLSLSLCVPIIISILQCHTPTRRRPCAHSPDDAIGGEGRSAHARSSPPTPVLIPYSSSSGVGLSRLRFYALRCYTLLKYAETAT